MAFYDFEYDGICLSSYHMILGEVDGSSGVNILNNGAEISFNTVPFNNGITNKAISSAYNSTLETTFQIIKNPCCESGMIIEPYEFRAICAWLSRSGCHKLRFIGEDAVISTMYYNAAFNLNRIELNGAIIGIECNVITDSPFGYEDDRELSFTGNSNNWTFRVEHFTDVEGFVYPKLSITPESDGTLTITNNFDGSQMVIANCESDEVITIEYPFVVQTTSESHDIANDFNWHFLTLSNNYITTSNLYTVSIPAQIHFSYTPLVQFGI